MPAQLCPLFFRVLDTYIIPNVGRQLCGGRMKRNTRFWRCNQRGTVYSCAHNDKFTTDPKCQFLRLTFIPYSSSTIRRLPPIKSRRLKPKTKPIWSSHYLMPSLSGFTFLAGQMIFVLTFLGNVFVFHPNFPGMIFN